MLSVVKASENVRKMFSHQSQLIGKLGRDGNSKKKKIAMHSVTA